MQHSPTQEIDLQLLNDGKEDDMKLCESKTPLDLKQSFDEIDEYIEKEDGQLKTKTVSAWMISAAIHATIALLFSIIVFTSTQEKEIEYPPVTLTIISDPIKEIKKENLPVKLNKEELVVVINEDPRADDRPIVPKIDPIEIDETISEMPKGELDNVSIAEMGGKGFNMAIGVGGGGSGIYGNRNGIGRKKSLIIGYGPRAHGASSMIENALRWLAKHQSPNGEFDSKDYYQNCTEDPKCEPGTDVEGANVAMTSYALLCFAGAGYDHLSPNKFKKNVQNALVYLLSQQKSDGSFGKRNYENAIAVQAICDIYGLSQDLKLREFAQKGVNSVLNRQAKDKDGYGLGWDYVSPNASRNDMSVFRLECFCTKSWNGSRFKY
jgi:hypothetical protein